MLSEETAQADGSRTWFGYGDYEFISPNGQTRVAFPYAAEPPRGESLHRVLFSNTELPGFAWGNGIAWSPCGRYLLFDYSQDRRDLTRDVVILDVNAARFHVLPAYVKVTRFKYPHVFTRVEANEAVAYTFSGRENWQSAA